MHTRADECKSRWSSSLDCCGSEKWEEFERNEEICVAIYCFQQLIQFLVDSVVGIILKAYLA
jgi:hypothetical protein